jgi:hypothetical protein
MFVMTYLLRLKKWFLIVQTVCVPCGVQAEAEETDEHQEYNTR